MNGPVADQQLARQQIGRISLEELPSGFRIVVPRPFLWQLFVGAGILTFFFAFLRGPKDTSMMSALIFYFAFATAVTLFRLTQRQVIRVSASEIEVRHENFGLCWWKSRYSTEPTCDIEWVRARGKRPRALELSCGESRSRLAFEITQEEAGELLPLIQRRFGHIIAVR